METDVIKLRIAAFAAVAVLAGAGAASAHHSYGMFDRQKEQTLNGVVKDFEWTNPHSRVEIAAASPQGAEEIWDIEMGPPGQLVRSGWKRNSLKPGDKVKILINPLRDGKPGGHLLMVTTPSGEDLYDIIFKKPPAATPAQN
jgi:hypothetical protein